MLKHNNAVLVLSQHHHRVCCHRDDCFLRLCFFVEGSQKYLPGLTLSPREATYKWLLQGLGLIFYGVLTVEAKCEAHRKFLIFMGWGCFFPLNRKQEVTAGSPKILGMQIFNPRIAKSRKWW